MPALFAGRVGVIAVSEEPTCPPPPRGHKGVPRPVSYAPGKAANAGGGGCQRSGDGPELAEDVVDCREVDSASSRSWPISTISVSFSAALEPDGFINYVVACQHRRLHEGGLRHDGLQHPLIALPDDIKFPYEKFPQSVAGLFHRRETFQTHLLLGRSEISATAFSLGFSMRSR